MIKVENLTKDYDGIVAVKDLNFEVSRGEIVAFLGPNGAGKSTTMNVITCYLPPSAGTVFVADYDVREQSLEIREKIGYLPEDNPLYEEMAVYEYLKFIARLRGISGEARRTRIREVADVCGLKEVIYKDIGQLSHGYKQRVGVAQAIFHNPDILILDEPTSGLDPNQAREIRELIRRLRTEKTVILSTHVLSEAQSVADRVLIIHRGRIVADGTKEELGQMVQGKERVYVKLETAPEVVIPAVSKIAGVESVTERDRENENIIGYEIQTARGTDIRKALHKLIVRKKWQMLEFHRETADLEDIFRQLTVEDAAENTPQETP